MYLYYLIIFYSYYYTISSCLLFHEFINVIFISLTKRRAEMAYLIEHYPQNIFQFHKIEEQNEIVVEPDVHFQQDRKEYLFIIHDILKSNLKQIAEKEEPHGLLRTFAICLIPFYEVYHGCSCWCNILATKLSSKTSEDDNRIRQLTFHVYKPKELIEKYGNEIKSGKICGIYIENNFNGNSGYITDCYTSLYQIIELKFYELMSSYKSLCYKFKTLIDILNEAE
ncbi:hypothetical protein EDI_186070 [Entamoeba dispar SAW760]|uniref:Uncharacterized protein n=1 Tax=Entamoeba dispar (strain ATCC PRA-260 / SAW760) TaxID=370354 RepID=B0EFI0_ENTDS|nr:uncharacterized protein EDI_186070 [Entamoeba dispar SAW760]EDR26719.1 hypothetical protein EDI_186070 [Entamoeba dispar SAW760]|eukprot:EDR26719.1 hypothetical protein EDI_186070 [Entamoeba dispar SAW760]